MPHPTKPKKVVAPGPNSLPDTTQTSADSSALLPGVSQNVPKSTNSIRTTIPTPQSERIMQRYASGQSIRKISRSEGRARQTVTKIVRSEDMRKCACELRERLYALGDHALAAVEDGLVQQKDARLGYRLLEDIGAVPSVHEKPLLPADAEVTKPETLNRFELAIAEREDGTVSPIGVGLARMILEKSASFGWELPTPEEMRHNRMVADAIDEATSGNSVGLQLSNSVKWESMKALFEEKFREFIDQV